MDNIFKKGQFIDQVESTHSKLVNISQGWKFGIIDQFENGKGWTLKDLVAHIYWYEAEMVGMLEKRTLDGSPWWNLALDDRNERIRLQYKDVPLETMINLEATTFQDLIDLLEKVNENEFADASYFHDMPAEWQPHSVIASNTYEHYLDHLNKVG